MELLEAANVGDRLAGEPPDEAGLIGRGRVGADRCFGMSDQGGSVDPQDVAQEQFAVERGCPSRPSETARSPTWSRNATVTAVTPRRALMGAR